MTELLEDLAHAPRHVVSARKASDWSPSVAGSIVRTPTIEGIRVWDWAQNKALTDIAVFADVIGVDPTGTRIAVGRSARGRRPATLNGHSGDISDVAHSPDGDAIATSGTDGTVRLWTSQSGTEQLVLPRS